MSSPLSYPDRRTPAGLGPLAQPERSGHELLKTMAPDMERALGALKDFTRRDILLRFYADRKPRSVDEVASATGIHRSVAFDHLERLVGLGYLETERRRGLPGKPAKIYRLTAGPLQISHPMRRYDIVAEGLARSFDDMGEPGKRAIKRIGLALGRDLAVPEPASLGAALEPLVEMGASYEDAPDGQAGRVSCANCLFAEVCRRAPSICHFHAGLIEGLTGADVESLGFRDPAGCAYQLATK